MVILGALVNGLLTVVGGVAGLIFRRFVSKNLGDFLMQALGLCVVLVAIQGMAGSTNILVVIGSMVIGALVGYAIKLDEKIQHFGDWVQAKLIGAGSGQKAALWGHFSEGFVASTLFICIGSMAIVGSLQSGLTLNHDTLFAKALIDMVTVAVMAASLGIGVPFSGACVFVYEAVLSLAASLLAPILSQAVITAMTVTGSLLLLSVGLNMLNITKIRVANLLPAAFAPLLFVMWL